MDDNPDEAQPATASEMPATRGYQQEMLDESMRRNIIIALDTGSGKTLIAVLRIKHEMEREPRKISWFFAPTVALCEQQKNVIKSYLPVSVGIVSGANEPDQWKDAGLWERVLRTHRVMISTPQVFLDALRHGYISLGNDISLLVFDEAHHAVDNHPYNRIMMEFYFDLPLRTGEDLDGPVRPMILGLTASPIYGGNVIKAFEKIESNLDSTIRAPRFNRAELAKYVHRPIFRHVMYNSPAEDSFSTNLASLSAVIQSLDIENDPYVISLRAQLKKSKPGSFEQGRIDQKLSKVIQKENSFTHKGLRDFERAAMDICKDLGPWPADWFVWNVIERAKKAANPYDNMMTTWKRTEKVYLLDTLNKVTPSPVSYYPDDIGDDSSDKTRSLIECLLLEKSNVESRGEAYSSIIFVQRRDAVIALAELLRHHPRTKGVFEIGILLGTSESSLRHSMMDITRTMVKDAQEQVLSEFKAGEKNLIVSTSVAEEGIDIQACCSVIRWDPPLNMASWAQSRGRARKKRSTFTLMFEEGNRQRQDVVKWEILEQEMVALYNDPSRTTKLAIEDIFDMEEDDDDDGEGDNDVVLYVESTGALLTLHSAVSHLSHFCAVIPNTAHADNRPLYDIDPPEFPEGWHALAEALRPQAAYSGPYGSKVTLPRSLPLPERQFSTERIYKSIISAHRHAAFKAYKCLFEAGLLNDNLLPITSVVEPELEDEVKAMLADVEKRAGFAKITMSVDPWAPEDPTDDSWQCSELTIEGLPPLYLFTKSEIISLDLEEGPKLYRSGLPVIRTSVVNVGRQTLSERLLSKAQHYTRRIFWGLNNTRMEWDNLDFSYLLLPIDDFDTTWDVRRSWLVNARKETPERHPHHFMVRADDFGENFGYPSDLTLVHRHIGMGRPFKFIGWQHDPLSPEEEEGLKERYGKHFSDVEVTYPLLVVQAYPPRTNFLIPISASKRDDTSEVQSPPLIYLLPRFSGVVLLSPEETDYAFLLPSILRSLSMSATANSLRKNLFSSTPLENISIALLTTAITAPSSGEKLNYQRMETLGDAVLKFTAGLQLLAEYPLWHEGYLTRKKDHAVSNVRLAKEDISRGLYRWIIRDIMLGKKWKPKYFIIQGGSNDQAPSPTLEEPSAASAASQKQGKDTLPVKKKKSKKDQQLSTKVLADVVESVTGAAYLYGGFSFGYECLKFFNLGMKWEPIPARINQVLSRVERLTDEEVANLPPQLGDVESMLGYTFKHKLLLIEALTHGSYQSDSRAPSYERMEFLGDSVLDMIVTDYLYHAPGKNYSPGHMHLRKSAVVNGHILAYICLKTHTVVDAAIPRPNEDGVIEVPRDTQDIHLWRCLLHSNSKVLEDQLNTFTRYCKRKDEIEESLMHESIFPWAALTRLQAPKFFSDMIESIIGAIFLDSEGSMSVVKEVLVTLGIMPLLEHIVKDDVDILHPVSRLALWSQKHDKTIEYVIEREKGDVSCTILVDGKEEVKVTEPWRGKPSQEEAKYLAAEMAIKELKLRDVGVGYETLKKKNKPKKKKAKTSTSPQK